MGSRNAGPTFFVVAVLALVLTGLLLARGGDHTASPPSPAAGSLASVPATAARPALGSAPSLGPHSAAASFLRAYLRYEAGQLPPKVIRIFRSTATPAFAAALVDAPTRPAAGRFPRRARLRALRLRPIPGSSLFAELAATALRGHRIEHLSFVLRRVGLRWLVAGVGE